MAKRSRAARRSSLVTSSSAQRRRFHVEPRWLRYGGEGDGVAVFARRSVHLVGADIPGMHSRALLPPICNARGKY